MIKKNVFYSFLIRGLGILTIFLLTRLTLHYVDAGQYGIWLTISALVNWINTFDIGLGHGLRNKMAHSVALNERDNIVKYVSTTFAMLFLIASAAFIVFAVVGSFFNWNELLNVTKTVSYSIWPIIIITLGIFCAQFFLQPIHSILIATHQQFKSSLLILFGQLLTLIIVCLLILFAKSSLLILVIVIGGSPVLVYLLANIYFFSTSLKQYAPRFGAIDMSSAKSLMGTGSMFFFIQLGGLVLFETDNIIITNILGPQDVTSFNLSFRYLSLAQILFSIAIAPYWSAFTDAYAKKDMLWIRSSIKKMWLLFWGISTLAVVLLFISPLFYKLWLGDTVSIPFLLTLMMTIYVIVGSWQAIYISILNGIGKLKVQLIMVIVTALLNIPLSIILLKWIGIAGTVLANVILSAAINIVLSYQVKLVLKEKDTGIWSQ
jgi:O-antigen/teichoic acid export membrane protein